MRRMKMKKNSFIPYVVVLCVVILTACAPTSTPQPVAVEQKIPQCSVAVTSGMGWSEVVGLLGYDYQREKFPAVIVNGVKENNNYLLQPGDFVVLESKENCSGEYVAARQIHFESAIDYRELSGFETPITSDELLAAFSGVCKDVRAGQGFEFDGDIYNGGCGYSTFVKIADADGFTTCSRFDSAAEAYESTQPHLATAYWIAITSTSEGRDFCKNP